MKFYRDSRRAEGYAITQDVANREASKYWGEMTQHDRQQFKEQCEETASGQQFQFPPPDRPERPPPPPKPPAIIRRMNKLQEKKRLDYVQSIQNLEKHVFSLAVIRAAPSQSMPCEITAVRMSIERGILAYFHVLTNPEIKGDVYADFRRLVGDKEAVVRIKDTPNSVSNRRDLRSALVEFCGGKTLLVPRCNYGQARESLRNFNFDEETDVFDVLVAEDVFQNLSQQIRHFRLTKHTVDDRVDRGLHDDTNDHLRCAFHKELPDYECSLKMCLGLAYALESCFPDELKVDVRPVTHYCVRNVRPQGVHYRGHGVSEEDVELQTEW